SNSASNVNRWDRKPNIIAEKSAETEWIRTPVARKPEVKEEKKEEKNWRKETKKKVLPPIKKVELDSSSESEEEKVESEKPEESEEEFFPIETLTIPFSQKQKHTSYLDLKKPKVVPNVVVKDDFTL